MRAGASMNILEVFLRLASARLLRILNRARLAGVASATKLNLPIVQFQSAISDLKFEISVVCAQ